MSTWRRKAAALFPELRDRLAGGGWELVDMFDELCVMAVAAHEAGDVDLLRRIHGYGEWCLKQGGDLWRAAGIGFYEDLFATILEWDTLVPWLSPYVIAELRGTWVAKFPDRSAELADLVARRTSHPYRENAYWSGLMERL